MSHPQLPNDRRSALIAAYRLIEELEAKVAAAARAHAEPIAIIGMGCRLPGGGNDPEAFWQLLRDGIDTTSDIPADRWDIDAYYDPDPEAPGKMYMRRGAFLTGDIGAFDAQFFGIAPREAEEMDPQHRLLLEVAWEALERAGVAADRLACTVTGVYIGVMSIDYGQVRLKSIDLHDINPYLGTGNGVDFAAGRLSYFLGLQGPSMVVATACSSSLVATHLACQALRLRECDLALAGGVNLIISPHTNIVISKLRAGAPDGRCKVFDSSANGYGRGEGAGLLVLKRLADAQAAGDPILAVIRGSGTNHDGPSGGLTVPNGPAQERLIRDTLARAAVRPEQVHYVETHGTGTALGDPIEVNVLGRVFAESHSQATPLLVGSVKTNIGHLEAAAGVASVIKAVLALQHGMIPPHLHLRTPNPHIDWARLPLRIPAELCPWPSEAGRKIAGVSSFGMSGINAHLLLEEATAPPVNTTVLVPSLYLLTLSTKTPVALRHMASAYAHYLAAHHEVALGDVCYTAATGRAHFQHRLCVTAATHDEFANKLQAFADGELSLDVVAGRARGASDIAFLFAGDAFPGTDGRRALYETHPHIRATLDRCAGLLASLLGQPGLERLWLDTAPPPTPALAEGTTPALFAWQYALGDLFRVWGVEPTLLLGTGVGEYVAACLAGAFSLEDGLRLATARGRILHAETTGGGERHDEPARTEFEALIDRVAFQTPALDWLPTLKDRAPATLAEARAYWQRHLWTASHGSDILAQLRERQLGVLLDFGAGSSADAPASQTEPLRLCLASAGGGPGAVLRVLSALVGRGIAVDWDAFYRGYGYRRVPLPTYPFQRRRYWAVTAEPSTSRTAKPMLANGDKAHPLLQQRLFSPLQDVQFETRLSPGDPAFLRDHRVFDTVLVPATAYLEMALTAARTLYPNARPVVTDAAFHHPLSLDTADPKTLHTVVSPAGERRYTFQIFSLAEEAEASEPAWLLHASGTLMPTNAAPPQAVDVAAIRARCHETLEAEFYYRTLAHAGVTYGPAFQGVRQLHRTDGEVLAHVQLPEGLENPAYTLHPAQLDACLQAMGAAFSAREGGNAYLPVGLERLDLFQALPTACLVHAQLRPVTKPHERLADVTLLTPAGDVLTRVTGFTLRQASRQALSTDEAERWFYEVVWRPKTLAAAEAVDPTVFAAGQSWLCISDTHALATLVAARLHAMGARCLVALAEDATGDGAAATWRFDATRSEEYERLLAAAATPDQPLYGIVLCYGGDPTPLEQQDGITVRDRALQHCDLALRMTQALTQAGLDRPPLLVLATRGALQDRDGVTDAGLPQSALWGLGQAIAMEHPEFGCLRVDLPEQSDAAAAALVQELFAQDGEDQIAYRDGQRYVARLLPHRHWSAPDGDTLAPGTPYQLDIEVRGTPENLHIVKALRRPPGPEEIEIRVHATGLNFRDVLNVLGLYPGDPGPPGGECAGIVVAVGEGVTDYAIGDRVLGVSQGSFSKYAISPAILAAHIPANLPFEAAATIPLTWMTAYYTLHHLAGIKAGDRVLIHAAAGGVGLAAVQIAQRAGAEIYATASPGKWDALRRFGVSNMLNSRDLDFADQIMERTAGRGVDIVLNSLSGAFLDASFQVLAAQGRFIELGKRGIWTPEQVAAFRPQATYHVFDLIETSAQQPHTMQAVLTRVVEAFANGTFVPPPLTVFPLRRAAEAFRLMQRAEHIGKIAITQTDEVASDIQPVTIHQDATYLITGGLGGLGLTLARWLAERGAGHLVLVGRSAPQPDTAAAMEEIRRGGTHVVAMPADVAQAEHLERVLAEISQTMPPLRGVIHAAAVLDDSVLTHQHRDRFARVLTPKIAGAWNLHRLTRHYDLDFFVLFSSIASVMGSPGQANYLAANAFLDALTFYRERLHLPTMTVNWGAWSEVGLAAELLATGRLKLEWMEALSPRMGMRAMERLFATPTVRAVVAPLAPGLASEAASTPFYAELRRDTPTGPRESALLRHLQEVPVYERLPLLTRYIGEQVARVLGIQTPEELDHDQGFFELGMDSLTSIELRNRLQTALAVNLPSTLTFRYPTVTALSAHLAQYLPDDEPVATTAADHLDALSQDELAALLADKLSAMQEDEEESR